MPDMPMHQCNAARCKNLTADAYCDEHKREKTYFNKAKQSGWHRGKQTKLSAHRRGYTKEWTAYAKNYLLQEDNRWCQVCFEDGIYKVAVAVDHIEPHDGDEKLFWDPDNHQPICRTCHARKTAKERGIIGVAKDE